MRGQLSVAWGEFLSQFEWDWFVTLTFREWVNSFRAHRLFEYFVRDLDKAAGQPIFWFRADEIGPHGGRLHLHALIGNVGHLRRMSWVDHWDRLAGFGRILPYSSKRGAAFYVAKYVTKQLSDWELSDNLPVFGNNQRILPLQGETKPRPPSAPASPQASVPKAKVDKHPRTPQQPMPFLLDRRGTVSESDISAVYRSEVTRGRGRYRDFGFPESESGRTSTARRQSDVQRKR